MYRMDEVQHRRSIALLSFSHHGRSMARTVRDQELPLYFDSTRGKPGHKPTAGKEEEDDERDRAD